MNNNNNEVQQILSDCNKFLRGKMQGAITAGATAEALQVFVDAIQVLEQNNASLPNVEEMAGMKEQDNA